MGFLDKIKYKNISVDTLDLGEDEDIRPSKKPVESTLDSIEDFKLLKEIDSLVNDLDSKKDKTPRQLKSMNEFSSPSKYVNKNKNNLIFDTDDKSYEDDRNRFAYSSNDGEDSDNDFIDEYEQPLEEEQEEELKPRTGERVPGTNLIFGYQGGFMTPYICDGTGRGDYIITTEEAIDEINRDCEMTVEDWHSIEQRLDLMLHWDMINGKDYYEIHELLVENMPEEMRQVYNFRYNNSYKLGIRTFDEISEFARKNAYYLDMEDQNGVYHSGINLALMKALRNGNLDGPTFFDLLTPYPHLI